MASSTHTVTNQPPPLIGYDAYSADRALRAAVERHLDPALLDEVHSELAALGRACGSAQGQDGACRPTRTRPGCAPTTGTATVSTRWSSIRPGTGCSARASRRA